MRFFSNIGFRDEYNYGKSVNFCIIDDLQLPIEIQKLATAQKRLRVSQKLTDNKLFNTMEKHVSVTVYEFILSQIKVFNIKRETMHR